ncbi:DUF4369 domain-containing protein [Aquimarina intermedia]|uniref:Uncharacterized protein DUF4369 n=1 Tax=Aquimarina intermedia TaxID=350814 RepID=A0A5S5C3H1_9FLAO|nr:DUF4369 domain-containing protein [Aquimarina intermedia]TYP72966.1 uncharacterized protein DUF4369 [Aquimarina intermedia]
MKYYITILTMCCLLISCSSPKKGNVIINGTIKGLKKGTVYLQKVQDTILVNVDSVVVEGDPTFVMSTDIKEPEVMYLFLDKEDGVPYNDRLNFFAEPGEITINTTLMAFEKDVKIKGGKNEMKLQEFKKMNQRFNDRNLRLIKENFEAGKQNDQEKLMENDAAYKKLLRQKYLYTINFAVTNRKLEVSPYVTLNEIFDANLNFLDTIAKAMSPRVKKSMYGKQLIQYIEDRKAQEAYSEIKE